MKTASEAGTTLGVLRGEGSLRAGQYWAPSPILSGLLAPVCLFVWFTIPEVLFFILCAKDFVHAKHMFCHRTTPPALKVFFFFKCLLCDDLCETQKETLWQVEIFFCLLALFF